ncbi:hypothetical protein Pmani_035980, partial [Petrolisthes manimaculis]
SGEGSPHGSPSLDPHKTDDRPRANTQPRPAPSFFTTLRTKFQRTLSKEKTLVRRKDMIDGVRSNSHPDVSVERQDSTTDYAADNSSAEQSSSNTPHTMSPRHIPLLPSHRQQSQDASGLGGEFGDHGSPAHLSHGFTPPTPGRARYSSQDARSNSPAGTTGKDITESDTSQQNQDPVVVRQRALRQHSFFQLHVHLKRGQDLVARDACGTSDPYVKFKVQGKMAYKSKTIYKDLNPTWDESFTLGIEDPFEPVIMKVFDYDWGLQDDFMGLANIDLTNLELDKTQDMAIALSAEPGKPTNTYMGVIYLSLTLHPKTQEEKEQVSSSLTEEMEGPKKIISQGNGQVVLDEKHMQE